MMRKMTATVKSKNELVVPASVNRAIGLKTGDRVKFRVSGRTITILPELLDPDDMLTPAEERKLRRALEQIKEGKTVPWAKVKHELGL